MRAPAGLLLASRSPAPGKTAEKRPLADAGTRKAAVPVLSVNAVATARAAPASGVSHSSTARPAAGPAGATTARRAVSTRSAANSAPAGGSVRARVVADSARTVERALLPAAAVDVAGAVAS